MSHRNGLVSLSCFRIVSMSVCYYTLKTLWFDYEMAQVSAKTLYVVISEVNVLHFYGTIVQLSSFAGIL